MSEAAGSGLVRVPTGIRGFDTIVRGGFFKAGLYIVQGAPGTGKTTLANQICFNHVAGGERALYVTLLAEYHSRMIQHLRSKSCLDVYKKTGSINYISGFGTLRQDGPKALLDMLRREIAACGASILVLDGFATAERAEPGPQSLNEFVHELQAVATGTDCTMFLLSSAKGTISSPVYTGVDGIVELTDELSGWAAGSSLQVVKLRGTGYLRGRHAYQITDDGLQVYPRIEALLARPSLPDTTRNEKVTSGIDRLDSILGGGLPAASTTLLIGPTGVGKTTLGLQFLARCSTVEPGLMFGFYETPARISVKALEICPELQALIDAETVEVLWQPPTDGLLDARAALARCGAATERATLVHRRPRRPAQGGGRSGTHGQFPERPDQRVARAGRHHDLYSRSAGYRRAACQGAAQRSVQPGRKPDPDAVR